ncbi:MAG: PIN/TRAM domain-containing protein [bacterium]
MYVFKVIILLFSILSGYFFFHKIFNDTAYATLGGFVGFGLGFLTIIVRDIIVRVPIKYFVGGFLGFAVAMSPLYFFTSYLDNPNWSVEFLGYTLGFRLITGILLAYVGISVGIEKSKNVKLPFLDEKKTEKATRVPKVFDTSVLIDGRVVEIIESGFLEGPFIVPQFVIKELQALSDSLDPVKRSKGRRGLDVIAKIQKITSELEISDIDFFRIKEVDLKLVSLAKKVGGKLVTTDYNLSKVAELQGIFNLNLNVLANALKPSLIAGETIFVYLLKEGKEPGQGVAYLDDGTMVVVEDGKKFVGQKMEVEVKSVLQTPSGRIIFSHIKS